MKEVYGGKVDQEGRDSLGEAKKHISQIYTEYQTTRGGGAGPKIKIRPPDPAPRGSKCGTATPDPGLVGPQEQTCGPQSHASLSPKMGGPQPLTPGPRPPKIS
jgi:hypothetical protein